VDSKLQEKDNIGKLKQEAVHGQRLWDWEQLNERETNNSPAV